MKENIAKLILFVMITIQMQNISTTVFANDNYDYSNPIYSNGIDDTFVYDSTDSIVITKKNIKRKLPKVTGMYDISKYPIPLKNIVPDKETFELIKSENKQIMDNVEKDIENGTLTKHKAADGQFFGSISDDVLGVEKKVYINTNAKGSHSLASYVPAGEIATIKLNDEALKYAKRGKLKICVGMTMVNAEDYNYNNNNQNRMPYLGKTFSVNNSETKVGTPFGGMLYIDIDDSVPSGLRFEVDVKGVVDTPYYDLGRTTDEEWKESKNTPGLFAEIRTPYLRFMVPSKFIRNINNPHNAALFWTNVAALSSNIMDQHHRVKPMSLVFDQYITAGIAYASVGSWICNLPPDWATGVLDYDNIMKSGEWGTIHEINHHYQRRYLNYSDEWGVGDEFSEITNNALSSVSYILYTNIAAYRGEEGTYDWNKVADPYSSLKQQIYEGKQYYPNNPNIGNFMYSTFAHEIGPINFINVVKSTYDGGTFNGVYIPPYDYKLESDGEKSRSDRYDDLAYRLCVASERDYTWYIQNELLWPIKQETINKIKSRKYKETIPVQSVYSMGELGRETGRPFFIPSTGYVFDFGKSLISPGKVTVLDVSTPKYGTLTKLPDGKYEYKLNSSIPKNAKDEFILTVKVEADGIINETKLNCTIGIDYNSSNVEKFNITKWDIHEALEDLKIKHPYATSTSIGMKIYTDDGNNLARATGYFIVDEPGEYEFQAFGDDRAVFELNLEDGTTLQSLTEDYSENADSAYNHNKSTNFITKLEANKPYAYTLICNNNGGAGWADINIRKTSKDSKWKSIKQVYSDLNDVGKITDRTFEMPKPEYVRPHILASGNESVIKNLKVINTPKGVEPNNDPNLVNEGNTYNIVDGDINTYFHSSYSNDKTPLPHEYIFDLGEKKSFNNLEVYTRRTGDAVGVIGNYEIYVSDEYDGDNTTWTKIAENYTRKGNSNAPSDLKIKLPTTSAKYLKIKALNNRDDYDLTIIAEVKLSTVTNIKNVIAQNSSFIQYKGEWTPKHDGAFVSGGTYNTTTGYFMYCFKGKESNIYVTKDTEVEIKIDGGKWQRVKLKGSLREPSITLNMVKEGNHVIEVRAINQEIALNMISTDGIFYKGKSPVKSDPPIIDGANDITINIGDVDTFNTNLLAGITVTDDNDIIDPLSIKVIGTVGKPVAGKDEDYKLTYKATDSDGNITTVDRIVTVTNRLPEITANDVTIKKGQSINLLTDPNIGLNVEDYEDGNIKDNLMIKSNGGFDEANPKEGVYSVVYTVTDNDGNTTDKEISITVKSNNAPVIIGADKITIKLGEVDTFNNLEGITVSDDHDIIAPSEIKVTGQIDKPLSGTNQDYTLIYEVKDSDGNVTSIERIITVTNQKPEIHGISDVIIGKGQGKDFDFSEGITATDHEDGDVTKNIIFPKVDLSTLEIGNHELIYKVTDSDGNASTFNRVFTVNPSLVEINNVPIILAENKVINFDDNFNPLDGTTAEDKEDGDITKDIKVVKNNVDVNTPGTYEVTYEVTDSQGAKATKTITVIVNPKMEEINSIPVINAEDKTLTVGDEFNPLDIITAEDKEDGDITKDIKVVKNNVDVNTPGTYEVTYEITDSQGAKANKTITIKIKDKNIVTLPNTGKLITLPYIGAILIAIGSLLKRKNN